MLRSTSIPCHSLGSRRKYLGGGARPRGNRKRCEPAETLRPAAVTPGPSHALWVSRPRGVARTGGFRRAATGAWPCPSAILCKRIGLRASVDDRPRSRPPLSANAARTRNPRTRRRRCPSWLCRRDERQCPVTPSLPWVRSCRTTVSGSPCPRSSSFRGNLRRSDHPGRRSSRFPGCNTVARPSAGCQSRCRTR